MTILFTKVCYPILQEYTDIDLSWQQRHLQMTPLFAATLASQSQATDGGSYGGMGEGMIRGTQQALAFTPTQGVCVCSYTLCLVPSTPQSSLDCSMPPPPHTHTHFPIGIIYTMYR